MTDKQAEGEPLIEMPMVYAKILDYARHLEVEKINELDGLWEAEIDEKWTVKVNGHDFDVEKVPPFHALVEFNGWPAGIFGLDGGIFAAGEAANEDSFIAAVDEAMKEPV